MTNAIVVKNLVKHYGDFEALKGISFSVKKGEIFGLLGPNGSGKTTLIHCITQLATFTSGSIKVLRFNISKDYLEAKKQLGLSPQEPVSDFYFSLLKTLIYQAGYFGIKPKVAKKTALNLLKRLNLLEKKDARFKMLSGGMKRKMSLAKALVHKPSILILDEPTAALDVDARHELWRFVRELNSAGVTIFLTTHYIEEAQELCDRICILSKGKIDKIAQTKTIMEELSQNIIKITLLRRASIPKELHIFDAKIVDGELHITTTYKDQSETLRRVLRVLEEKNISFSNFTIEPDSLENIFRRIVNE